MGHGENNSAQSFLVRSTFNTRRLAAPQQTAVECQGAKSLRDSPLKRALSKRVNQDTDHR
jgi:hypothetical protein